MTRARSRVVPSPRARSPRRCDVSSSDKCCAYMASTPRLREAGMRLPRGPSRVVPCAAGTFSFVLGKPYQGRRPRKKKRPLSCPPGCTVEGVRKRRRDSLRNPLLTAARGGRRAPVLRPVRRHIRFTACMRWRPGFWFGSESHDVAPSLNPRGESRSSLWRADPWRRDSDRLAPRHRWRRA